MKIRPLFAWYDLWVGVFWDRKGRKLYILPIPCVGMVIEFYKDRSEAATCKIISMTHRLTTKDVKQLADYFQAVYDNRKGT